MMVCAGRWGVGLAGEVLVGLSSSRSCGDFGLSDSMVLRSAASIFQALDEVTSFHVSGSLPVPEPMPACR
jgi:hypothetical protein